MLHKKEVEPLIIPSNINIISKKTEAILLEMLDKDPSRRVDIHSLYNYFFNN